MTKATQTELGPLFDEAEQTTGLGGVTVKEAWVGLQLLDKAAASGIIQPTEFAVMAEWRASIVGAIGRAVGKDYDQEIADQRQKHLAAQQAAAQQQDAVKPASTNKTKK